MQTTIFTVCMLGLLASSWSASAACEEAVDAGRGRDQRKQGVAYWLTRLAAKE